MKLNAEISRLRMGASSGWIKWCPRCPPGPHKVQNILFISAFSKDLIFLLWLSSELLRTTVAVSNLKTTRVPALPNPVTESETPLPASLAIHFVPLPEMLPTSTVCGGLHSSPSLFKLWCNRFQFLTNSESVELCGLWSLVIHCFLPIYLKEVSMAPDCLRERW